MNGAAALARTASALRDAALDARRSWSLVATGAIAAYAVAALLPAIVGGLFTTDDLADQAYLALAATGLALCVGLTGMPSLAQGAFVGIGAFVAARIAADGGAPAEVAALGGAAAATAAGVLTGLAVRRLDAVRIAVATWLLTWLVALALNALPWLSGGAQGIVVPRRRLVGLEPTALVHYELAVLLTGLCALALATLRRAPFGLDLTAARQHPSAAAALGVPAERLRLAAFAASAFVGGLAGGLAVQLDRVADPTGYGPFVSFELLVAVLVGGAAWALGPTAGVLVLAAVSGGAHLLGSIANVRAERFEPMLDALLLLAVLAAGGVAIAPAIAEGLRKLFPQPARDNPRAVTEPKPRPARLRAANLRKTFGEIKAADDVALEVAPGTISALIGPNGSGKTTVLRLLSGTISPDAGTIELGVEDVTAAPPAGRVARGLVRTLQATSVFTDLTVLENALVGVNRTRSHAGAVRALFSTPAYRAETRLAEARARAALDRVGLADAADRRANSLASVEQRLLMVATALATNPAVLLVDEPAAGAGDDELPRVAGVLEDLRDRGLAVLVVDHNLRLVRAIAGRAVVLSNGRVVAQGSVEAVADDPYVREAYLGTQTL